MDSLCALLLGTQALTVTPAPPLSAETVRTQCEGDAETVRTQPGNSKLPQAESIEPTKPEEQSIAAHKHLTTCEYCTRVSHHVVLHDEEEMNECKASREPEPEKALQAPARAACPICGSFWANHSESARLSCESEIEKAQRELSEQELAIIAEFNSVIDKLADIEVNYLLVSNYFRTENKKLFSSDELLRRKIAAYQKCYVIGRIGESTLHQDRPEKMLELKGSSEAFPAAVAKERKKSEPKVKKSPKERQIEKWVSLGMTEEAALNLWADTLGKKA
jgi:hypothetical protein